MALNIFIIKMNLKNYGKNYGTLKPAKTHERMQFNLSVGAIAFKKY